MTELANWLLQLVKDVFTAVWTFIQDVTIEIFSKMLDALVVLFASIPIPCFFSANTLQNSFNALSGLLPSVWFFAQHFNFAGIFAVLSCAVLFVIARRLATLFQW